MRAKEQGGTMAISLYDVSVTNYLQTLGAASHFLEKAAKHLGETRVDLTELCATRIYPDMLPFRFQIQSIVHHSVDAIEALKTGAFGVAQYKPDQDYAALQAFVKEAEAMLQAVKREDVDAREDAEVTFQLGPNALRFTGVDFILSFSLPNLHFHATTAYDILRSKGVPLGKRDYMGRVRLKR